MVTSKTGTVQKFPKPRGRAPKNASGQPATWDPDRGEWTGVVKKTKPDGVPKPRGRAPLGATWDYDKGEWVGGKPKRKRKRPVPACVTSLLDALHDLEKRCGDETEAFEGMVAWMEKHVRTARND